MRTIFLAAKYIAIQKGKDVIEAEDIAEAINSVEVTDPNFKKILASIGLKRSKNSTKIDEFAINIAMKNNAVKFSEEANKIKRALEQNGYGFNTNISNLKKIDKSEPQEEAWHTNQGCFSLINKIKKELEDKIYSQEQAIETILDKVVTFYYRKNINSLKAIFFFLGPPATGKTYLAEILGEILTGYSTKVFNMSTYQGENQNFALTGLSAGYKNEREGDLTKFVKEHPKSICVFDEIEKAHPNVQNVFLDIMARGKTDDDFTKKTVDFSECIFIFTSNLGSELYSNKNFLNTMALEVNSAQNIILETISREKSTAYSRGEAEPIFKPEFLSRLAQGEIVLFNKLTFNALLRIARENFQTDMKNFEKAFDLKIEMPKEEELLLKANLLTYLPFVDARRIKSKFSQKIFDNITDLLRSYQKDIKKIKFIIDSEAIKSLKNIIKDDPKQNDELIMNCFRKNQTLKFLSKIEVTGKTLIIKYHNAYITKLPKSVDYSDEAGSIIADIPSIKFDDIAGHEKAKKRLNEIAALLKNKEKIANFNIDAPKGILLYGPPGTGKTMLAKAFANEAELPFISTTGSELLDMELMKKVFKRAREYAPSIIFIDEIDAIGKRDGSRLDILINQFLTEINGFGDSSDIFTIAATNLKEKLDPAILRSGRIDIHIHIGMLDKEARGYFIDKMLKNPTVGSINKSKLIKFSVGMSGADLQKAYREASLEALRNGLEGISEELILEHINNVKYGDKLTGKTYAQIQAETAYHEAGHAIISHILMPHVKIEQITVEPRGKAFGFVAFDREEDVKNLSFDDIKNQICVSFAGRTAEIYFQKNEGIDTGATNDLKVATNLAYSAVKNYGMSNIGYINLESIDSFGGKLNDKIDNEVLEILKGQKIRCEQLIKENEDKINKLAKLLMEKEVIDEDEFLKQVKDDN